MIWGYPYFWKHPYLQTSNCPCFMMPFFSRENVLDCTNRCVSDSPSYESLVTARFETWVSTQRGPKKKHRNQDAREGDLCGNPKGPLKTLVSQWLNFKLFGITCLVGKIYRSNFFFQGPLAKWENIGKKGDVGVDFVFAGWDSASPIRYHKLSPNKLWKP